MKAWREECGVFGIWNDEEASRLTYLGLYALQHRGQEAAGIVTLDKDKKRHIHHKGLGLVADVFTEDDLDRLKGVAAIGHVRYSTAGQNILTNAQPLTAKIREVPVALAHNGNLVNSKSLRKTLSYEGAIFQGSNDSEVLLHLLALHGKGEFLDVLRSALERLQGAYSLVVLNEDSLIAARDPHGFRPLALGWKETSRGQKAYVVASETCAFDLIGAHFMREIEPGEVLKISDKGIESCKIKSDVKKLSQCIFEYVYFSRPDSRVYGKSVYQARKDLGRRLAEEAPVDADVVIPIPDSGVPSAIGYSEISGVPFDLGIIRNHYVGRTFIEPKQSIRSFGVKVKLNPQREILNGKKVIVIDDSLVRGTTCRKIINLVRQAGAKEVHLRIAAPPTLSPCYYGVDTPEKCQLIAASNTVEEIREFVGADSLAYLSMEGLLNAAGGTQERFCTSCFDGSYPTAVDANPDKS